MRRRRSTLDRFGFLMLGLLLVAPGCADSDDNGGEGEGEGEGEGAEGEGEGAEGEGEGAADSCTADRQCDAGEICKNLVCIEGCRTSETCPEGQFCKDNKCRSNCTADAECGDGRFCSNGVCRDGCSNDNACGAGKVCVSNKCVAGECNVQKLCPEGKICNRNHECVDDVVTCSKDAECGQGQVCVGGACVRGTCSAETKCPDGQQCNANHNCELIIVECTDTDGDGYGPGCDKGADCDDTDKDVNPGVTEDAATLCDDGIDNDCDGRDAVCGDVDEDGDGVTVKEGDCDDSDPSVSPKKEEIPYNGKDDDCKPATSDVDVDGDGHAGTQVQDGDDCNDGDPTVHPDAREIPGNGKDEDCDGEDGVADDQDRDGDGFTGQQGDCDDNDAAVNPDATEVPYNRKDDDCDPATKDNDLDGDGVPQPQDCADDDPAVKPGAAEVPYNGKDDDCNEVTSDTDVDGDGVAAIQAGGTDCNDQNAAVKPGGTEVTYNGLDDDCDPATKDDDLDGDGFRRAEDCNDTDATVNPGATENAEVNCSDGIDHDCAGGDVICGSEWLDADGDGFSILVDCDDDDPNVNPGAPEISNNGKDDDCNAATGDLCTADRFDRAASNGSPATATPVEDGNTSGVQYTDLMICHGDHDWYRIDLLANEGLEVDIFFQHAEGDLDLEIVKVIGGEQEVMDASWTEGDTETAYVPRAGVGATYYIHVYGYENAKAAYKMTVNVFSDCIDDWYEHNDQASEAYPLDAWEIIAGQVCDRDDDWYSIELSQAGSLRVDLLFQQKQGDLDLRVLKNGQQVGSSNTSTDDERVTIANAAAGVYQIHVTGYNGAKGPYRLMATVGATERTISVDQNPRLAIPDATASEDGYLAYRMALNAPANSVAVSLTIKDLDINHTWLPDLFVALEMGDAFAILWANEGDATDGTDGGVDDDWFLGTSRDINFDNRRYHEFDLTPLGAELVLHIWDEGMLDTGDLADIDVDLKYLSR